MLSPLPTNEYIIDINLTNGISNGNSKNVSFPSESHFNYHTHPLTSYVYFKTHKGWPSDKDYKVIIRNYLQPYNKQIYFSCVSSIEGIYVISFNLTQIKQNLSLKDVDRIIDKYYTKNKATSKFDVANIQYFNNDIQKYLTKINTTPTDKKLFNVILLSWASLLKNKPIFFEFQHPKRSGRCLIDN